MLREVYLVGICTGFRMVGATSERPAAGTTEGTSHDPKTAERPILSPVCGVEFESGSHGVHSRLAGEGSRLGE